MDTDELLGWSREPELVYENSLGYGIREKRWINEFGVEWIHRSLIATSGAPLPASGP